MVVVAMVTVAPLLVTVLVSWYEQDLQPRMLRHVDTVARQVQQQPAATWDKLAFRNRLWVRVVDAEGRVQSFNHDPPRGLYAAASAFFFGPDGAPTVAAEDEPRGPLHDRAAVQDATAAVRSWCARTEDLRLLVCTAVARLDSGDVVVVQESSRRAIRALFDFRYPLLKLVVFIVPFAALLAWWLGWRMVHPLERLRAQVLAQSASVSSSPSATAPQQVELQRNDEFGDLAAAFNVLLQRLHARDAATQEFLQDFAHEAKNPVAAIRAAAESLQSGKAVDDKRAQRLGRILDGASARLDSVVNGVLELSRAEAGLPGEDRTAVSLGDVARGVVDVVSAQHPELQFALVDDSGSADVEGVEARLESVLSNLVHNAASFAGRDVVVRLTSTSGEVVVHVVDDGPGVASDVRDRVFERFFTTRPQDGGTGVGLALAQAVVVAHGGTLELVDEDADIDVDVPNGAHFKMVLPRR